MIPIDHDLHIHTYLSACCKDPDRCRPAAIVETAEALEVKTIGFADHVWANPEIEPSPWYAPQGPEHIRRIAADVAALDTDVRVLQGCEAETIAPGRFGITPEFAEQMDFVLLACSHFHMNGFVAQPRSDSPRDVGEHCLTFFRAAVDSGLATVIPHSFLPLGFLDDLPAIIESISDAEFLDAYGLAAERGVGIEITTGYLPTENHPRRAECGLRILSLAKQAGCQFTFGSDAHDLLRLHRLPDLARFVQALDLTEEDIHPIARR